MYRNISSAYSTDKSSICNDNLLSMTIDFMRFPLMIGVVILHCGYEEYSGFGDIIHIPDYPLFHIIYFFTRLFGRTAVPLFFFISGFLFFYKISDFTSHVYFIKLKKRIKTLFIPYVIWNIIIFCGYIIIDILLPNMMYGQIILLSDCNLCDWLIATFWNGYGNGAPINTALWFVRDLMLLCFLTPVIYVLVKRLHIYMVIFLGLLWITNSWVSILELRSVSVFFFTAGAWFSINNKNFIRIFNPNIWIYYLLFYLLIGYISFKYNMFGDNSGGGILCGSIAVITTSAHFVEKRIWKPNTFLSGSSFFIYCFHLSLAFLRKPIARIVHPHSNLSWICLYCIYPAFLILLGLFFYYIIKRFLPKVAGLLSGNR